jgi:BMFP domain-containing protein YqiC
MQTQSRFFDDLARVANGALSAAAGVRAEIEQLVRQQFDRFLADRNLVTREEFEAVEAMAAKARGEQEKLAARVAELEAALAAKTAAAKTPARKPAAAKPAATRRRAATAARRPAPRRKSSDETPSGADE